MYFVYSILLSVAFIGFLPYFLYQAFFHKKYLHNFSERLGFLPIALRGDSRPTIWIHAVSVGETLAACSLVQSLRAKYPAHRIVFTTTTATGQAVARARIPEADYVCYFPFDWKFSVRRALDFINPKVIVLMESELWPNFLAVCRTEKIPVLVVNGRVSDRSFRRSIKFAFWFRRMTANVTQFLMQSNADAERIVALGADPVRVSVSGNLKYDLGLKSGISDANFAVGQIVDELQLSKTPLIIAGSTTDGEEELVLAAFTHLRAQPEMENVRLLIAPRHPERFDAVERLLNSSRFQVVRRSTVAPAMAVVSNQNAAIPANNYKYPHCAEIILLDSIGELAALYQYGAIVFIGGSLVPKGGHNILEPAFASKPIIVGPYMQNFREITAEFLRRSAVIQLTGATDQELIERLASACQNLLSDQTAAHKLGANAKAAVDANRGATERTVQSIAAYL